MLWLSRQFLVCFIATLCLVSLVRVISTGLEQGSLEATLSADADHTELDTAVMDGGQGAAEGQEKDSEEEPETKLFALARVIEHPERDPYAATELVSDELAVGSGRTILSSLFRPPRS